MLIPLVQVFGQLVYFQAVENDTFPAELHSELCDAMARESLCRIEVPAPLGDDRERFMHLIADLRNRRDDYAAQLRHVTLAGISSASRREAESRSSILSRILSGRGMIRDESDARTLLLWQARLILKLGEIHDAEQEQLNAELRRIGEKEENLLHELRREADASFVLPGQLAAVASGREDILKLRCRAWARMFALGGARSEAGRIFLSGDSDAVDRLLEQYERSTGEQPTHLLSCMLPAAYPDRDGLFRQIERFRSEGAALLGKMDAAADKLPGADRPDSAGWTEEEGSSWEKLLAQLYPEKTCGRARLSLYLCPGISPPRLFTDAFAHDSDEARMPSSAADQAGLVLGILRRG